MRLPEAIEKAMSKRPVSPENEYEVRRKEWKPGRYVYCPVPIQLSNGMIDDVLEYPMFIKDPHNRPSKAVNATWWAPLKDILATDWEVRA